VVERQPEKLKVVGSNPIPDKMLFLLYFVFFLILTNFFDFVFNFTPTLFLGLVVILNYSLKHTTFSVSFINVKYFGINIFLQLNLLRVFFKTTSIKYLLNSRLGLLKWKPLFKKSSYFGIYRSTRNQFLNK
jgi:hypothetical protein